MNVEHFDFDPPEKLLKASEVAGLLNISRAFAYQLMNKGELRTVAIGAIRRVRPEDLERFIEKNIQTSPN